jgi:hypothetical protein
MPDVKDKAPNPQDDKADEGDKPEALTLTQEQLDAKIAEAITAAVAADRKAQRQKQKAKAKAQPQDDEDGDDEEEDSAEIIRKAEQKAAEAAQRADEAEKKALLAEVKGKLTDWLGLNARDFIGNAPDIMLHIERQLSPGAKDGEVARVIEANAKAFIERTKAARGKVGNPVAAGRNRIAGVPGADNPEDRQVAAAAARTGPPVDGQRWSTLNYHG